MEAIARTGRVIQVTDRLYTLALPLIMRTDPQWAHDRFIEALRVADDNPLAVRLAHALGAATLPHDPVQVGGVILPHPLILSAGLVKGDGFASEAAALAAVHHARNIIPGWRVMPALVGPVEFGSFTRYPRLGNPGKVIWRDAATQSTQNRVGLRNPGAAAAAEFLSWHLRDLPPMFGVNIAVSPGVSDPGQEREEALQAAAAFISRGVKPSWFTLNLSCPNTEDDPHGNQTENKARALCGALVPALEGVPLWVKVGPCLSDAQYAALMAAFAEAGVRAVIATNTLPAPTPDGIQTAGVGGGRLREHAQAAVRALVNAANDVDVIACGGILDGESYRAVRGSGAAAAQYYSATIYRSPLAAAIIYQEGA